MSQHHIIGSEAFDERRYIIVRHLRPTLNRRRRNPVLKLAIVAIIALLAGITVAVFALGPLVFDNPAAISAESVTALAGEGAAAQAQATAEATAPALSASDASDPARQQMRFQPVEAVQASQGVVPTEVSTTQAAN